MGTALVDSSASSCPISTPIAMRTFTRARSLSAVAGSVIFALRHVNELKIEVFAPPDTRALPAVAGRPDRSALISAERRPSRREAFLRIAPRGHMAALPSDVMNSRLFSRSNLFAAAQNFSGLDSHLVAKLPNHPAGLIGGATVVTLLRRYSLTI